MTDEGKHLKTRKEKIMTKAALENALRAEIFDAVRAFLSEKYDVDLSKLQTGAGQFALPLLDAENNERYATVTIAIPRGTRTGAGGYTPYDGYDAAEDYRAECAEKEAKRIASAEKKEAAAKLREQKRALRAKKEETPEDAE